jgi:hypothetical protein
MEKVEITLPAEVAKIAESVSVEKRNEVQEVLNKVFSGVEKMRKQIETIEVSDHEDKASMQLARVARLAVRAERLEAEKKFDSKRDEVQAKMLSFKTEDSLWLKAKQTMQILTKELEEVAKWKEETKERFDAEQRELKIQDRILKVQKFNPNIQRSEFESMSDETFNSFLSGLEASYLAQIEAERKAEEARQAEIKRQETISKNRSALLPLSSWIDNFNQINFETVDCDAVLKIANAKKKAHEDEQERIRLENEKLRKDAEAKELALKAERKKAQEKLEKEKADARRLADELQARKNTELKAENEKKEAALKAQKEAEKLAKAPIKKQLENWVNSFEITGAPVMNDTSKDIQVKFTAFKKWAISEINKL